MFVHEYFVFSLDEKNIKLGGGLSKNQIGSIICDWFDILDINSIELIKSRLYHTITPKQLFSL